MSDKSLLKILLSWCTWHTLTPCTIQSLTCFTQTQDNILESKNLII